MLLLGSCSRDLGTVSELLDPELLALSKFSSCVAKAMTLCRWANSARGVKLNLNYAQIHFASVAAFVAGWRSS